MKQDPNPTTVCGQCGIDEPKLFHNVRLRGNFRRLCTTCVLRLHPQCFCPACLGVYDGSPPNDAVVCYKCYSSSHPHCIPSPPAGSIASSRPCSSCLNPNLLLLNVSRVENGSLNPNLLLLNVSRVENGSRVIDCNAARLLLAAGKIASMSMSKAEAAAAMEAERRAKEAAYTKKRAREALDHVVRLMGREKRNVSVSVNNNINGNVNNGVAIGPVVVEGNVVNKVDDSNEVLKALNAVELKDNGVVVVENVVSGDGVQVMKVDVGGKDSGIGSVVENGSVKKDDLVKIGENGQEQGPEKVPVVVENNLSNPVN